MMKKWALLLWKEIKNLWEKITSEPFLRGLLIFLLVGLSVLFLIVVLTDYPIWTKRYLGLTEKEETLKFLGIGMGGVLLALQALMSYKRAKALEDTVKNTEQGQRQERLKNAIEHLGHKKDSVRLGGAYELFHLAEETKEWRQTILDILCAHIRQTTGEKEYREKHKSKPSEEMQSLLTLLFVQEHEIFKGLHINLQGSWLNRANLNEARLERAVLVGACLQGTQLENSHLREANLSETRLALANLKNADLRRAVFREAHLQGTLLHRAYLQEAKLYSVQMQGAELIEARMQGVELEEVQMQGADLRNARLQLAFLSTVRLQAASLGGAQFQAATLEYVYWGGVRAGGSPFVETRIESRSERPGSFDGVIFQGGMGEQDINSILKDVSHEKLSASRAKLQPHIGKPESHQLPEGSSVDLDAYTRPEAEEWIAEYEAAMPEVPRTATN